MVAKDVVTSVNKDLKQLLQECNQAQDSPRLIRLVQNLITLTELADHDSSSGDDVIEIPEVENEPAGTGSATRHVHTPNVFGICTTCRECLHTNIHSQTGDCITCGKTAKEIAKEISEDASA